MAFDPEFGLGTPDATQNPGTFDWTPPASGSENAVFAFDVILPASPPTSGLIFEQGGSGRGIILIYRQGHLRFRFGDGGTAMTTVPTQGFVGTSASGDAKYIWDVPVANLPFDGSEHTIVWEVVCEPASSPNIGHRAWCDGELLFDSKSSNRVESDDWSGSASGGFLNGGTNMPDEVNYDGNWPDQTASQEARLYLNTSVTAEPGIDLVVADGTHSHAADSPTVTTSYSVSPDDASHAHTSDQPTPTVGGGGGISLPQVISTSAETSATSLTGGVNFALPSGIQAGDLVFLFVFGNGSYAESSRPAVSGWTEVGYYGRDSDISYYSSVTVLYVVADSGTATSNPSVSTGFDPIGTVYMRSVLVRGGSYNQQTGTQSNGTSELSTDSGSVTTTQDNSLILHSFNCRAVLPDPGLSSTVDNELAVLESTAYQPHYQIGYNEQATAGASTTVTYTLYTYRQ